MITKYTIQLTKDACPYTCPYLVKRSLTNSIVDTSSVVGYCTNYNSILGTLEYTRSNSVLAKYKSLKSNLRRWWKHKVNNHRNRFFISYEDQYTETVTTPTGPTRKVRVYLRVSTCIREHPSSENMSYLVK